MVRLALICVLTGFGVGFGLVVALKVFRPTIRIQQERLEVK